MKYLIPVIAVVALILGVFAVIPNEKLGGQYSTNHQYFNGITNSGTFTQTGAVAVTVTSTLTGNLVANGQHNSFGSAVTSTIQIGAASKSGCIILGDSANGASPVYITATGATVTASTTKPAACKTVR